MRVIRCNLSEIFNLYVIPKEPKFTVANEQLRFPSNWQNIMAASYKGIPHIVFVLRTKKSVRMT
jgi:hypothetical protein